MTASRALKFIDTTLGQKAIVAATGVVLFGFVIAHMLGNLQVFLGPVVFNNYAAMLKGFPALLWGARFLLLVSVVLHAVFTMKLVMRAREARPVGYRAKQSLASTYASRTMPFTGPMLALFIVYHLAHFTWPGAAMANYVHSTTDVYNNVVSGFSVPWVSAIYLVAQVLLGIHLYHGAWSLFQTLGLNHPRYNALRNTLPVVISAAVVVGNLSIPTAVLLGVIQ